jgi:hypothetical protein
MALPLALNNHNTPFLDFVDLEERLTAQLVLPAATSTPTPALTEGLYDVWATTDIYIRVQPVGDASAVTAANGYLIRANNTVTVLVRPGSHISALSVAGGTMSYQMIG